MSSYTKKLLGLLALMLASMLVGGYIGRITTKVETKTEIKYVPQPVISDSIIPSKPVEEITIPEPEIKWLTKHDTVRIENTVYVTETVDTAAILADWTKLRKYTERLFDVDTVGTFDVTADVQYNQLQHLGYRFTPVRKEVHTSKVVSPALRPYVLGGVNSQWRPAVEVGTFTRSGWGAGYEIQLLSDKTYLHSLKIGYQF